MKRLYKFIAIMIAAIVLAGCNKTAKDITLPNFENMEESIVNIRLYNLSKELDYSFEYQYSDDVPEYTFIDYKGSLKAGDKVKPDEKIVVLISSPKYKLPNLRGSSETEVVDIFNNLQTDIPSLNFEYVIEYAHSDVAEGRFIGYKEPFETDDILKIGDKVTVLISADKFRLPNLDNKTKTEIEDEFNTLLEGNPLEVTLQFQYVYDDNKAKDEFLGYAMHEAGDRITRDTTVIINLSTYFLAPDLTGLNRGEIEDLFSTLLTAAGHGITVNYGYYYPTNNNLNQFVSYADGLEINSKIMKGQTITVGLVGEYLTYPSLEDRTERQVEALFNNMFKDYLDEDFVVFYDSTYDDTVVQDVFVGYIGASVGDVILDKEIVVKKLSKDIILPDLRGLNKEEMEDVFEDLNVNLNRLIFTSSFSENVLPGEFIRYEGVRHGDKFDIRNNFLTIYFDDRPILPSLDGLNKKQIEDFLAETQVVIDFRYIINNDKEYDLFAGYEGKVAGDGYNPNHDLIINLYKNDDVNIGDDIVNSKELFISKYIDGTSGNQGIELYNATDEEIDLEDYYIAILSGGSYVPTETIPLTGTILSNEPFVIVNSDATIELINKSHMQTSLMSFGASATIQLRKVSNDTYIDSVYDVGNRSILMDREIYVRREGITHGRRDYRYLEWMGFVVDFYDLVGIHPYSGFSDPVFELIEDKNFQEYGMTEVSYIRSADGDTVYFNSIDPNDPTSYDGDNRIRFLLINTPETQKPGQIGEPYANVAKDFTDSMLRNATKIYIQSSLADGKSDTYGRHLGLIWVYNANEDNPTWKLLNYELLKAGLGTMMVQKSGRYYDQPIFGNRYLFSWANDADTYARVNKLGLYSGVHKD